jgi:hypothetical protein
VAAGVALYGCSATSSGAAPDGGSVTDGASVTDGSPADRVADAKRRGPYDSAASYDDSGAICPMPADVSRWAPPEYRHAKHQPTACTAQEIVAMDTACLASGSSKSACTAYMTANATCYACLVSQATDATWGPVYLENNIYQANIGGCIELTDPTNTSCAQAQETAAQCEHAACDTQCPVSSSASFSAYQQCTAAADQEGCTQFITAATTCLGAEDAAASVCNPPASTTFDAFFLAIAPLFCSGVGDGGPGDGGPAGDGGADAGDAAAD